MSDHDLKPEEFAQAAAAAVADAVGRDFRGAAAVLAQSGLCGVCAPESVGGLALDTAFAVPLVAEAGRQRLPWPLWETLLVAKALGEHPLAAALVAGDKTATWALQGTLAEGWVGHARFAEEADWVLVADGQGGAALIDKVGVAVHADPALDPDHPQAWLALTEPPVLARLGADAFAALQRDAQVLVASLAHGAAEGALVATATYLSTRVQFGRPLSAKQAVRHLLARMRLQQEAIKASILRVLQPDEFGAQRDAQPVLVHALAQTAFVLEKALHLHGGMGFTWELPLHHALREVRKFDAAFGAGALAQATGRAFVESV